MKSLYPTIFVILFGVALCSAVQADEPAKHDCVQPPVPGKFASDHAVKEINKKTAIYKECINKFAQAQQEISKNATDIAKANAAHDAGEAAMKEFNDYIARRNKVGEEE